VQIDQTGVAEAGENSDSAKQFKQYLELVVALSALPAAKRAELVEQLEQDIELAAAVPRAGPVVLHTLIETDRIASRLQ
jgi:hypothetical protein